MVLQPMYVDCMVNRLHAPPCRGLLEQAACIGGRSGTLSCLGSHQADLNLQLSAPAHSRNPNLSVCRPRP